MYPGRNTPLKSTLWTNECQVSPYYLMKFIDFYQKNNQIYCFNGCHNDSPVLILEFLRPGDRDSPSADSFVIQGLAILNQESDILDSIAV